MIEDDELRQLFQAESDDHLQGLEKQLLLLESTPQDRDTLQQAFRHAHSLKGSARMLGLKELEHLAHHFESVLNDARSGTAHLTSELTTKLLHALDRMRTLARQAVTRATPLPAPQEPPPPLAPAWTDAAAEESLRVPTRRLDELLSLAAEVTSARIRIHGHVEALAEATDQAEELMKQTAISDALRSMSTLLREDSERLESVAGRLEERLRQLRMVPLATMFGRFRRMVRDLAQLEGKQVDLTMVGGETGADRSVLDELKDPLMHLLRNAVDHGIETPPERTAAGKPVAASLVLRARRDDSTLVVEVEDDGRGLDIEKICDTALKQQLLPEERILAMTPQELSHLILLSGFSTSSTITDVS